MGEFHGNQHTCGRGPTVSRAEIVKGVATLAAELGRAPTTEDADAADHLPSLATLYRVIDSWDAVLADAGVADGVRQVEAYDESERDAMRADLRRVHGLVASDHLTMRQYDEHGAYATSTVKQWFDGWAAACEAAGLDSGSRHGEACVGPNGERLASRHEQAVARFLDERNLTYEPHPSVPDTRWRADFRLPACDLWIEVDGYVAGDRPNQEGFEAKLAHYEEHEMAYAVVTSPEELADDLRDQGVSPE